MDKWTLAVFQNGHHYENCKYNINLKHSQDLQDYKVGLIEKNGIRQFSFPTKNYLLNRARIKRYEFDKVRILERNPLKGDEIYGVWRNLFKVKKQYQYIGKAQACFYGDNNSRLENWFCIVTVDERKASDVFYSLDRMSIKIWSGAEYDEFETRFRFQHSKRTYVQLPSIDFEIETNGDFENV